MVELVLRPLRKLEDSLCLYLARATNLLERAGVSDGGQALNPASFQGPCSSDTVVDGSILTAQAPLIAEDGDQGVEDNDVDAIGISVLRILQGNMRRYRLWSPLIRWPLSSTWLLLAPTKCGVLQRDARWRQGGDDNLHDNSEHKLHIPNEKNRYA